MLKEKEMTLILGIESSCDETATAIVDDHKNILASTVWSQYDEHRKYKGVVPEIAARAHLEKCDLLIKETLNKAGKNISDMSAIAVAAGPGLIGGVLVGVMTAKALSFAANLPFIAVNHLEGHALMARLHADIQFPYLLMLTSGGHCQVLIVKGVGSYEKLGETLDDSAGECFDKVAKMLDIGYPGGPNLEKWAERGNPDRFAFPVPMKGKHDCVFSFSGVKTAVRTCIENLGHLSDTDKADIAASFQKSILKQFENKLKYGIDKFKEKYPTAQDFVVSGGVAANQALRSLLQNMAQKNNLKFSAPPISLCTDNGVMIAWAGMERYRLGMFNSLDFKARPRWPLTDL